MQTELIDGSTDQAIALAVARLRAGELVALPTETVYGLAADALNSEAVAKIFEAKERPHFDPLIVHLPHRDFLERVARIDERDRGLVEKLIDRFWPGPFTMVLSKRSIIPDLVTAGLDTVAVRMSADPIFYGVAGAYGLPLAAPSANRFGRISPTTAEHVMNELAGRISLILDGGPTTIGIESTIVGVTDNRIEILRSGPITKQALSEFAPTEKAAATETVTAPGQLTTHYAPRTPLRLLEGREEVPMRPGVKVGLLAWNAVQDESRFAAVRRLSQSGDLRAAATNLFRHLRELDELKLDLIVAEAVPEEGLGVAIMDRLRRAAGSGAG